MTAVLIMLAWARSATTRRSRTSRWRQVALVAAFASFLLTPSSAFADPPTLKSVSYNPDSAYSLGGTLEATWTLPSGFQAGTIEVSGSPATGSDGRFSSWEWANFFLEDGQTSWTTSYPFSPGIHYVHVSDCPISELFCNPSNWEWSSILSFVAPIPLAAPQPPPQATQAPGVPTLQSILTPASIAAAVAHVQAVRSAINKGVPVLATCVTACKIAVELQAKGGSTQARRSARSGTEVIGSGAGKLAGPGDKLIVVHLTRRGGRKLRGSTLTKAAVRVRIVDVATGSARSLTRQTVFKRKAPRNRPPEFQGAPSDLHKGRVTVHNVEVTENFQYDSAGRLVGISTEVRIKIVNPATDSDGDPLAYSWHASHGSIVGNAYGAIWKDASGTATVTVRDGRGGSDTFTYIL